MSSSRGSGQCSPPPGAITLTVGRLIELKRLLGRLGCPLRRLFSPRTLGALAEKAGLRVECWRVQGRYLHLGYLLSRLSGWSDSLGRLSERAAIALGVQDWLVPVNFRDLFTFYARKPEG